MDLGVLGYYRQMILHSSDADERDVFYMLFELASALRPASPGFACQVAPTFGFQFQHASSL
jgi:hypothetical protein